MCVCVFFDLPFGPPPAVHSLAALPWLQPLGTTTKKVPAPASTSLRDSISHVGWTPNDLSQRV